MKTEHVKFDWYWGSVGFCGILGYILEEPLYYTFFACFIFFLIPVIKKTKK
jgi:hypothetical protein